MKETTYSQEQRITKARELVLQLREKWPSPIDAHSADLEGLVGRGNAYCVGGACVRLADKLAEENTSEETQSQLKSRCFPSELTLALALTSINPNLAREDAVDYASAITNYNDDCNYEAAYRVAEEAFRFISTEDYV